jgi:hypothetical protein
MCAVSVALRWVAESYRSAQFKEVKRSRSEELAPHVREAGKRRHAPRSTDGDGGARSALVPA